MPLRILLVSYLWPWRTLTGGRRRLGMIAEGLRELGQLDLFVVSPLEDSNSVVSHNPYTRVGSSLERASSLFAWANTGPNTYSAFARVWSRGTRRDLARFAAGTHYDLVWYMGEINWLKSHGVLEAPSIVDVDDLEDISIGHWLQLGEDHLGNRITFLRRMFLGRQIRSWRRLHRQTARKANLIVFASDHDRKLMAFPNAVTVPNTYPAVALPQSVGKKAKSPTLLLQGFLKYEPNVDGVRWMIQQVLPIIQQTLPNVRLLLAGRTSREVDQWATARGVEVIGLDDIAKVLSCADVVVVPLRVGGGTRLKILEAFAYRVPVVSTTIGAAGLGVVPGKELEIADSATAFAEACLRVLSNHALANQLQAAGHYLYQRAFRLEHGKACVRRAVARVLKSRSFADG